MVNMDKVIFEQRQEKMAQKFSMTEGISVLKGESNKAKKFCVFVE